MKGRNRPKADGQEVESLPFENGRSSLQERINVFLEIIALKEELLGRQSKLIITLVGAP